MRFRSAVYPVFILYELTRLFFLMKDGTGTDLLPLSWYAAVPLLCAVPVLFLMLSLSERAFSHWLPLICLLKALGIPSLIAFAVRTAPTALEFGAAGDHALLATLVSSAFFVFGDLAVGIFCFGRNRILCK